MPRATPRCSPRKANTCTTSSWSRSGESIWLDAEADRLADLKRRLSIYRLRAKVSLDDRADLAVAAVFGERGSNALDLPEQARRGPAVRLGRRFRRPAARRRSAPV